MLGLCHGHDPGGFIIVVVGVCPTGQREGKDSAMRYLMTEEDIRGHYGLLTPEQQEAYEEASLAFRSARAYVTELIESALGSA